MLKASDEMKAETDAITLETFTDQLLDVQFCDNTPIEAAIAKSEVEAILHHMWRHYEASQRVVQRYQRELRECQEAQIEEQEQRIEELQSG